MKLAPPYTLPPLSLFFSKAGCHARDKSTKCGAQKNGLDFQSHVWYNIAMDTVSDILKRTIRESGDAFRRLEINTGVNRACIRRFLAGKEIGSNSVDALASHYGLELKPARRRKKGV